MCKMEATAPTLRASKGKFLLLGRKSEARMSPELAQGGWLSRREKKEGGHAGSPLLDHVET